MRIVDSEIAAALPVPPGTAPNYSKGNPLWRLVECVEATELACGGHRYVADSLQHLYPIERLALYGPSGDRWQQLDPRGQDDKNDFQKQNIRELVLTGMAVVRGYARAGDWTGPFIRIAYDPPARSPLAGDAGVVLEASLRLFLRVGDREAGGLLTVPYNETTHRYEIELWGYPGADFLDALDERGRAAAARGELVARPDLVGGTLDDFEGPGFDALRDALKAEGRAIELFDHVPDHTLHPLRALRLELAWTDPTQQRWDSRGGRNHRLVFGMALRGWRSYLAGGVSANPHGGVGTLEFRNLFSNYFGHEARRRQAFGEDTLPELGRMVEPWSFDAGGRKPAAPAREGFLAVDYMDLHMLRPGCGIGIHRHRDNQEVFMLLSGRARMITGDWAEFPDRDRAFEIRSLLPGDLVLIKGGQLHALINALDENITLFMFGGYD
jgi:hypothetical protein